MFYDFAHEFLNRFDEPNENQYVAKVECGVERWKRICHSHLRIGNVGFRLRHELGVKTNELAHHIDERSEDYREDIKLNVVCESTNIDDILRYLFEHKANGETIINILKTAKIIFDEFIEFTLWENK